MISTKWANGHFVQSAFLSNTKTKSPILKCLCGIFHFFRIVSDGIYSVTNWFQNIVANAWTIFYLALSFIWFSFKTKISGFVNGRPERIWLGVKASKVFGSLLKRVSGWLLIIDLISASKVTRVSSVRTWLFMVTFIALFVNLTIDSIAPPIHCTNGVLNLHSIASSLNVLVVFCWFSLFNTSLISHSVPTKFVPLLLLIKCGFPRGEVNWWNARRKLSVDKSPARSI